MTHHEDRLAPEAEDVSINERSAPEGGWPSPEYVRVRLLKFTYDGPVVSDSEMDVWNDQPAENFDLFGDAWRRIACRKAREEGQPIFLVAVIPKPATEDDFDDEPQQADHVDGYFPLNPNEPGPYQSWFTLRLDDGTPFARRSGA